MTLSNTICTENQKKIIPRSIILNKYKKLAKAKTNNEAIEEISAVVDNTKENSEESEAINAKQIRYKQLLKRQARASERTIQMIERSTMQEQLFQLYNIKNQEKLENSSKPRESLLKRPKSQNMRLKKLNKLPSGSESQNDKLNIPIKKQRIELSSNSLASNIISIDESEISASANSNKIDSEFMHRKSSVINKNSDTKYRESSSKMESTTPVEMNHREKYFYSHKNSYVSQNSVKTSNKSMEKIAMSKVDCNNEFLNFVSNTTDNGTLFHVHNNLESKEKIDFSLLKLKNIINKNQKAKLRIPRNMKEKFVTIQPESVANHVMDLINSTAIQSSPLNDVTNPERLQNEENSKELNIDSEKSSNTPPKESTNSRKIIKKNRIDEYDDNMFNFEKCALKTTQDKVEDGNSTVNSNVENFNCTAQKYFNSLKHSSKIKRTQSSSSIDSDDLSMVSTSNISDLSALRGSTYSKYEAVTKKIMDLCEEGSPNLLKNIDIDNKKKQIENITENENLQIRTSSLCDEPAKNDSDKTREQNKIVIKNKINYKDTSSDMDSGVGLRISNSIDETFTDTKTNSLKNCIVKSNKQTEMNIENSEESCIIFHKHSNVLETSTVFQKIDLSFEREAISEKIINSEPVDPKYQMKFNDSENTAVYDDIDPHEEFDFVNLEEFVPYNALFNKLKVVRDVQKSIASEQKDKVIFNGHEENSNEIDTQIEKYKSSTCKDLKNNGKMSTYAKVDDSKTLEIESNQSSGYFVNNSNTPRTTNRTTGKCNRLNKMKSALKNYNKNLEVNDIREESAGEKIQQKQQQHQDEKSVDAQKNESLRTSGLFLKRHQILNEIKKHNLHLNCKPILMQSLK